MEKGKSLNLLLKLYGDAVGKKIAEKLVVLISRFDGKIDSSGKKTELDQKDCILITYGDMVRSKEELPLKSLENFLSSRVLTFINTIHILPFFPYSSDDGFSIIDYKEVNPALGDWEDLQPISKHFHLMFDAVLNHISVASPWFEGFVNNNSKYIDYFITIEDDEDLSQVFRPRALPSKTSVNTVDGKKFVWTTFSEDQIDLNYQNPDLLLEMINVLLYYVSKGADFVRMDAVAYIWKERGTSCIHLPQVHQIVQLFRAILDEVAPWVKIITETNVPHKQNVSYFGNGENEAQLVYNFTLPPLVLHTFQTRNAKQITNWAASLEYPSRKTTFLNFLASHDGIGVTPALSILNEADVEAMVDRVKRLGGDVSYKDNADGSKSPYELNINFLDALCDPENPDEPDSLIADRFLASQAIMLALKGIPGIYFHSLFGSRNWIEGVRQTGRVRTINREKLDAEILNAKLDDEGSIQNLVFHGYERLLLARKGNPAFHPNGYQKVLNLHSGIFSVMRSDPEGKNPVLCIQNIQGENLKIEISMSDIGIENCKIMKDILSGKEFLLKNHSLYIELEPYSVFWLEESS